MRERAAELIPSGATVLVAGKGDEALLRLDGRTGWHFPMAEDGRYAGFHPAGDTAAIAQLEALRARGADHLLLPKTTLWWLDHYEGLRRHLEDRYTALVTDEQCAIFRLSGEERARASGPLTTLKRTIACLRIRTGRDPSILDWGSDLGIAEHFPRRSCSPRRATSSRCHTSMGPSTSWSMPADAARGAVGGGAPSRRELRDQGRFRVLPERTEAEWRGAGRSGWGEDVSITMIPGDDDGPWDATLGTFAEALEDGFAGEFSVSGDPSTLADLRIGRAAAAGVPLREIEAPARSQRGRAGACGRKGERPAPSGLPHRPGGPAPRLAPVDARAPRVRA